MTDITALANEAATVWPYIFANDFLRYAIGAGGVFFLINGLFSKLLNGRRIRERTLRKGQIQRELLTSLRTVFIFSGVGISIWAGIELGVLRVYEDPASLGWTWFWVSVVMLIVLHDAWFYWTHRLIHDPRLFRRFHRTHHKSQNPTPFTAYAFDVEEAVINGVFLLIAAAILPISGLAAFIFTAHMMLRNAIGHCGYELFPSTKDGRPLFDWMTTVTHHDLHHAQARYNYGLYFTWWDRWMGTEAPNYHAYFATSVRRVLKQRDEPALSGRSTVIIAVIAATVILTTPLAFSEDTKSDDSLQHAMNTISGNWATEGYGAIVKMQACDEEPTILCGTLIWAWDPSEMRPGAVGSLLLSEARFEGGEWRDAKLHHPENDKVFSGKIIQTSADMLELKGCAFIFCQTETWRRLESLPHIAVLPPSKEGDNTP